MKRFVALTLVLSLLLVVLAGCGGGSTETTAAATQSATEATNPVATVTEETTYKKAITIATTGDMPSAFPYGNSSTQTSITTNSTHNGLVDVHPDGSADPVLATEWTVNEDSTVWTFRLRDDVRFHDGRAFTSEDVKFTYEYCSDTANDGVSWIINGYNLVDSIETPDDYTVVFNMKASTPDWLFYAAQKIVSKGAVEELGGEAGGRIGTGPFKHISQETGVSWVIGRNDDFWGELPVTEQIKFLVITDASSRALTLKSGDVDAIFEANASDIVAFKADSKYNVYYAENSANVYLGFNCGEGSKGADETVRKAVAMAINRDDIVNACYENGACGVASYNIINNVTPGYVDVDCIPYDPEGSIKLLEDNGLSGLTLNLITFAKYKSVAEVVQADLSVVGINVNIVEYAQSGFTSNLKSDPSAFDMYINATSSSGGVLNIMSRFFASTGNASAMYYNDPDFDAALAEAMKSTTYDELVAAYGGLQQYLAETVPGVALVQTYLWCIGSSSFYGVDLGTQTYEVDFTGACVIE